MHRLRLFGGASIERSDGTPVVGRAAQRHRLALLALLAGSPSAGLSREKLIALLWPESDRERARNLLNVSVYELRKALGDGAILSAGDDLRLNSEVVAADVAELEAAVERGDAAAAVALYRGPLLDGFFVDDAPELERWVDRERERLAGLYARALEALAGAAAARGDAREAAEWWKRRAAHDPYDSRVALALMGALDASGNRAGAIQHAVVHERLLQQELGLPASPAVAALAERLRSEPAAEPAVERAAAPPVAPPTGEPPAAEPAAAPASVAAPPPPRDPARPARPRRRRVTLVLAALVLGVALVATLGRALWPDARRPERSVAVLPFVNMSPDGDGEYFSDGITEEIITRLAAIPDLKVISRTSAMRYKGSAAPLREIARELGVAHVLEGSVRREGDQLRITAQLIDADTDAHLWARSYDRRLVDVLAVQEEIAREVARTLEVTLGGERDVLARRGTRDPEAYELYLRGRHLWHKRTREGHEQAIAYFQQAIARDSTYADAWSGLADAHFTAWARYFAGYGAAEPETFARITRAAERAAALDPRSAAANTSLALARWSRGDWTGAERALRRAIELNPGYAIARAWYAVLLSGMGRMDEAVREGRHGYEVDPFALVASNNYGMALLRARRYDEAAAQYRRTLELDDTWGTAHSGVGLALAAQGRHPEAVGALRRAVEADPESPEWLANLAYVLALAGDSGEARRVLRELAASEERSRLLAVGFSVGRAYMALGELDSTFAWFERTDWRWPHRSPLTDPTLDPLRDDPRFVRLEARVWRELGLR